MPAFLARVLAEIRAGEAALTRGRLSSLSNPSPEGMDIFNESWPDIDTPLRRLVIFKLVRLAAEDVTLNFDAVSQACLSDADAEVRGRAIDGLEECEDCRLIGKLLTLLREDATTSVRASAARALGRFAMMGELGKIHARYRDRLASALLSACDDLAQPDVVRAQALESVAPLSLPQVTQAIQRAYHGPALRASAITAMGLNCDPAWLPLLLRELVSPEAESRERAVRACGELGDPEVLPHLTALAADPERQVGLAAIRALGQIGGREAKRALLGVCQHPDAKFRGLAEAALEELVTEEDVLSMEF